LKDVKLQERVDIGGRQVDEARRISRDRSVSRGDALHAVLARDNNAIIITRDKHFEVLYDIVKSLKPEEAI
jgi:predicted nucleic acid-binding protein